MCWTNHTKPPMSNIYIYIKYLKILWIKYRKNDITERLRSHIVSARTVVYTLFHVLAASVTESRMNSLQWNLLQHGEYQTCWKAVVISAEMTQYPVGNITFCCCNSLFLGPHSVFRVTTARQPVWQKLYMKIKFV